MNLLKAYLLVKQKNNHFLPNKAEGSPTNWVMGSLKTIEMEMRIWSGQSRVKDVNECWTAKYVDQLSLWIEVQYQSTLGQRDCCQQSLPTLLQKVLPLQLLTTSRTGSSTSYACYKLGVFSVYCKRLHNSLPHTPESLIWKAGALSLPLCTTGFKSFPNRGQI